MRERVHRQDAMKSLVDMHSSAKFWRLNGALPCVHNNHLKEAQCIADLSLKGK